MTPDLAKLKALAEAATQGEWIYDTGPAYKGQYHVVNAEDVMIAEAWDGTDKIDGANATFIAAANPTTILALISEIEALKAERDGLLKVFGTDLAKGQSYNACTCGKHGAAMYLCTKENCPTSRPTNSPIQPNEKDESHDL